MSALYARPMARQVGVTIRGVAYRCGEQGPGAARCEHPVGHDGPIMPPRRHVGRDAAGEWHVWEDDLTDRRPVPAHPPGLHRASCYLTNSFRCRCKYGFGFVPGCCTRWV